MSQSPATETDLGDAQMVQAYTDAVLEMNQMLWAGRSLSGRERHCMYLNTADGRFANVSSISGLDFPEDGRGLAAVDWDFDGDLDLWASARTAPRLRFLRNDLARGRFLGLRLQGNGTTVPRDAIGARVEIRVDGLRLSRTSKAGEGFLAQSSKWLHFGLGELGEVESLVVHWPDGTHERFEDVATDRFLRLVQGSGDLREWTPAKQPAPTASSRFVPPAPTSVARLPFATRTPLPRLDYLGFEGEHRRVRDHLEQPLVLTLWASWCSPCVGELARFDEAGLHVLALSVDGLGDDARGSAETAREFVTKRDYGFATGRATEELLDRLQGFHDAHYINRRPLPLPTTFLLDTDGSVGVIYKGPVTVEQIREDLAHLRDDPATLRQRATPFRGRWRAEPTNFWPTDLAGWMLDLGQAEEARAYLDAFGDDRGHPGRPALEARLERVLGPRR